LSDFDKLLAALMAGGSTVNVTVINAVHPGGVVNIKNGCVDVEKSNAPTPKKAQGEKKSQEEPLHDDHTSAAEDAVGGGDEAPIDTTPAERNRGGGTPEGSPLLAQVKGKLLALSEELTNRVVSHIDRISSLSKDDLEKIAAIEDSDLDNLDEILDNLFPDLAS